MKNSLNACLVLISLSIVSVPGTARAATEAEPTPKLGCTTAREYIAALEFLRDRKEFAIPEAEARKTAARVSSHCTGSAARFMRVTRTLTVSGLGTSDAIAMGEEFAGRNDRETDTFLSVFRKAFSAETEGGLDLDLGSSVRLARSLTSAFDGDVLKVRDDFETLFGYCARKDKLGLPMAQCGDFASEIARKGNHWAGSASAAFVRMFEFLSAAKDGPGLTTADALAMARETVAAGPDSADNFIQAYRYASARKGMDLPRDQAVAFARDVAFRATFTPPAPTVQAAASAATEKTR